jgi:Cu(I)/Ag(I) efflux system membrane fusion protein
MKMKSLFNVTLFAFAAVFALSNCAGKKEEAATHEEMMPEGAMEVPSEAAAPQFEVSPEFQQQLSSVFVAYVKLKDALVATDAEAAMAEAQATQNAFATVDMTLLTGPAHNDWMNYAGEIDAALNEIKSSNEIEAQRTSFSKLSDNMYKSIKAYGLGGATAYYEYCPMAFNNNGAYWLSDNSAIRNPYFGSKMLKCGTVEEKLK